MVVSTLETSDVLAKLDRELSHYLNFEKFERLMDSAAGECDSCDDVWPRCEWCHYWEFDLVDPEEYAKEDGTGRIMINEWDLWLDAKAEQEERYNYTVIEGLMQDFMGNDIWRGDTVAYATRRYNSAKMVVAEYLEPAEDSMCIWVKPLREATWGGKGADRTGEGYKSRVKIGIDNVLLLESKD